MRLWQVALSVAVAAGISVFFVTIDYQKDGNFCTPKELKEENGRMVLGEKRNHWLNRNTRGEVWWQYLSQQPGGIFECQIR